MNRYYYPENLRKYRQKNIENGLCSDCGRVPEEGKRKCSRCLGFSKKTLQNKRLKVLKAYGNKCVCCGESTIEFLTFDHINNDGHKRRPRNGYNGTSIYYFLEKNNYPPDIQILCYNCNCGRARTERKICPHKGND